MLVKNFNNLLGYSPFNVSYNNMPDLEKAQTLTGSRVLIASNYWTQGLSTWRGDSSQSDGVALVLSTSKANESIDNYEFNDIFSDYSITNNSRGVANHSVACVYSRTITPISPATINSVGLVCCNDADRVLIGFENLAEPIQLIAGEPHTFTFAIKV